MRTLIRAFQRLSRQRKLVTLLLVVLIALTWLAVCAVLVTYWVH